MRDYPDSRHCPAIIVQPASPRFDFLLNARLDETEHRAACKLPGYIDPATLRRLMSLLDTWRNNHGLHAAAPTVERVVR